MAKMYIGKKRIAGGGGTKVEANVEATASQTVETQGDLLSFDLAWFNWENIAGPDEEYCSGWKPHKVTHNKFEMRATDENALSMVFWLDDPRLMTEKVLLADEFMQQIPEAYHSVFINDNTPSYYCYTTAERDDILQAAQEANDTKFLTDANFLLSNSDPKGKNGMYFVINDELYLYTAAEKLWLSDDNWFIFNVKDLINYYAGNLELADIKTLTIMNKDFADFPFGGSAYANMLYGDAIKLFAGFQAMQNGATPQDIQSMIDSMELPSIEDTISAKDDIGEFINSIKDNFAYNYETTTTVISAPVEMEPLTNLKINNKYFSINTISENTNEEVEEISELEIRRLFRDEYTITVTVLDCDSVSGDTTIWSNETAEVNLTAYGWFNNLAVSGADAEIETWRGENGAPDVNTSYARITLTNATDNVVITGSVEAWIG